jgi:hypothetical protein
VLSRNRANPEDEADAREERNRRQDHEQVARRGDRFGAFRLGV